MLLGIWKKPYQKFLLTSNGLDFEATWKRQIIPYAKNMFSESLVNFVSYKRRGIKYIWKNTHFKSELTKF